MLIESVSILNFHEQLGLKAKDADCFYGISISLASVPDIRWRHNFQLAWMKKRAVKDKMVKILEDELLIELEPSDDIQSYIDLLRELIGKVNEKVARDEQRLQSTPKQKEPYHRSVSQDELLEKHGFASYDI